MSSPNPPSNHNQPTSDPIAHFKSIPWCNNLLSQKSVLQTIIPDRTPIASTESALVRQTLNTPETVKACITFLNYVKPTKGLDGKVIDVGEDPKNPFLQVCALLDFGSGINGYAKTAQHGGIFGVVLDEVMGTAANMQAAHGAFTVTLTVNFKKPLYTPQVVLARGKCMKREGKKLHMRGSFEDKDGNILAEATGLWLMVERNIGRWTTEDEQARKKKEAAERAKAKL